MTLSEIRRRPTLPGRFQPSTISVLRLNFCVRDGNRWIPQAIVTGNMGLSRSSVATLSSALSRFPTVPPPHSHRSRSAPASAFPSASLPLPRTLKTAQVRFRFAPSDHDFPPLLASSTFFAPLFRFDFPPRLHASLPSKPSFSDQALDRLVSPSSIHCCTSTDDLSTLSSSRGLTCSWQWQFSSLGGLHA